MFSLRNPIYLGGSMPIGSSIGSYNPLINYNWSTHYIGSERYLTDSGSSPKYHAKMFTGQGVLFNGINQSIDLGIGKVKNNYGAVFFTIHGNTTTQGYILDNWGGNRLYIRHNPGNRIDLGLGDNFSIDTGYDFISGDTMCLLWDNGIWKFYSNGIQVSNGTYNGTISTEDVTYSIGARDSSFNFMENTLSNFINVDFIPTLQQIQAHYQSPETFLYRENGILKSSVLSQSEIDNIVAYLPMCEKDEYIRDLVNYSEGVELYTDYSSQVSSPVLYTASVSQEGFDIRVISLDATSYDAAVVSMPTLVDSYYIVKIDVKEFSGTSYALRISDSPSFHQSLKQIVVSATTTEEYTYIFKATDTDSNIWMEVGADGNGLFNVSVKELAGIYPIENFTNSCRDNAKNLTSGLQTSKLKRDILGIPYGVNDYYEVNSTSYSEINIPLPQSYSFELVVEELVSSESQRLVKFDNGIGLTNNSDGTFNIYPKYNNDNNFIVNTISVSDLSVPSYIAFTVEDDGINSVTVSGYLNGSLVTTQTKTYLTRDTINIDRLFDFSDALGTKYEVKLFRFHNKAIGLDKISKNNQTYIDRNLLGEVVTHNLENVTHNGNTVWL